MTVKTPTCSPRAAQRKADCTQHSHGWAMLVFVFFLTDPRRIWATTNARLWNQNNYQHFLFLADIQECYEVTLQLNKEQAVVKDDSRADVWEVTFFFIFFPSSNYWAYSMLRPRLVALQNLYSSSLCLRPRVGSWGPQHHLNFLFPPHKLPSV